MWFVPLHHRFLQTLLRQDAPYLQYLFLKSLVKADEEYSEITEIIVKEKGVAHIETNLW